MQHDDKLKVEVSFAKEKTRWEHVDAEDRRRDERRKADIKQAVWEEKSVWNKILKVLHAKA